ncbi:MAG: primosomal protein N', partial [Gemmatimonadaceae bacterium]
DLAAAAAQWIRRVIAARRLGSIELVGPAPCPVERLKQRWRWHLVVKAGDTQQLSRLLTYFTRRFPIPGRAQARATADRDPVTLL